MDTKRQITEYLDINLEKELWCCNRCGHELISARENYKKGCLVYIRKDPNTIYNSPIEGEYHLLWLMASSYTDTPNHYINRH